MPAYSQNFSGKIINQAEGQPVMGATILIRETKQGVACDQSGEF
ncbi:MAG: CarboxypepD reg-like domain [Bacteroidetes bacterium]|nr:CarboxypepD reg-like domain [Bacteroidota bacterium]